MSTKIHMQLTLPKHHFNTIIQCWYCHRVTSNDYKMHGFHEHLPGVTSFHCNWTSLLVSTMSSLFHDLKWKKHLATSPSTEGKHIYTLPSSSVSVPEISYVCWAWHVWSLEEEEYSADKNDVVSTCRKQKQHPEGCSRNRPCRETQTMCGFFFFLFRTPTQACYVSKR